MAQTERPKAASEKPRHDDVVIIGGGMASLAAAEAVRRTGRLVALLEAGPQVGGPARSIGVGGERSELDRRSSSRYWASVTGRIGMGCAGIIEHTDFAAAEPSLCVLQPAFERSRIVEAHDSLDPLAQPVPVVGGPMSSPPVDTGSPGLFHASLAHVYPHDRGVSMAIAPGRRVAADTDAFRESG